MNIKTITKEMITLLEKSLDESKPAETAFSLIEQRKTFYSFDYEGVEKRALSYLPQGLYNLYPSLLTGEPTKPILA